MGNSGGSGGGTTSPLTTKGDVWGYSTVDARVPIGSNTQVLTADSTQALGLKWAAAAGVTFPLTNAGDETFQPNGIASNTLTLHNNASAVNGVTVTGSATGGAVPVAATGTDTNLTLDLNSKGTGQVRIYPAGATTATLVCNAATSQVNGAAITPAATGAGVTIAAVGSDANINLTQNSKGTGSVILAPTGATTATLQATSVASQVNGLVVAPAATGGAPQIQAAGTDANIGLNISPVGTGKLQVFPVNGSNAGFTVTGVASIANGVTVTPVVASAGVIVAATGTDTNIDFNVNSKGTGNVLLYPTGATTATIKAASAASQVNGVVVTAAATTAAPVIASTGTDANIGLTINPVGTGTITVGAKSDTGIPLTVAGNSSTQTGDLLDIYQNSGGNALFKFATASAGKNGITFTAAATASPPTITTTGDANTGLKIDGKGSGNMQIATVSTGSVTIGGNSAGNHTYRTTSGNSFTFSTGATSGFAVGTVASAVNYLTTTNAIASSPPNLQVFGTDTDIDLSIITKGAGLINYGYASTAISGSVAPATLATTTGGGTGPATAGQNAWLAVKINGTASYIPFWR